MMSKESMTDYWKNLTVVVKGDEHLGGNLRHGDTNSTTPVLWRYLVDRFAVRSLLDIGAGESHALQAFSRLGVVAHGFDGLLCNVDNSKYPIALHDLRNGPYYFPCDLTYCVELVEHIDEVYVDNLLATLINAPVIVMTHGLPGQPGHHHVNNQPRSYWIDLLGQHGYSLSIDNEMFKKIARNENADSYFSISGLVFLRNS